MTTYKTPAGLTKACEAMIEHLQGYTPTNQREIDQINHKVNNLIRQCKALWTNPADVTHFANLASELADSWSRMFVS